MTTGAYPRKAIAVRLLFTLFFLLVFEILKLLIQVTVLFQYVHLFIFTDYNRPVRSVSNKLSVYAYRALRYMTLSENEKPFPFTDFPLELEPLSSEVTF